MIRLVLLAALCAMAAAPAAAAPVSQITVTVDGQASTMPDMAQAAFTISTGGDTAAAATSDNNARYERLLSRLHALGIAQSDIQTAGLTLNYNPTPKPPDTPQPGVRYGYFAARSVNVTVRRLENVGKAIDTAVAAGVTDLGGVSFSTSREQQLFASALRDGIERARRHAQAMAEAAGLHILRVRSIQEGAPAIFRPGVQADTFQMAKAAPVPTQVAPSPVQTSATVTVTFEAQ